MAMDKNELQALLNKVPKITKTQEISPMQRLVFLYLQLQERKKVLYRYQVQVQTAVELAKQDDNAANDLASQQIKEATAQMKALRWEINSLNTQIEEHIREHGDLDKSMKIANNIDYSPEES